MNPLTPSMILRSGPLMWVDGHPTKRATPVLPVTPLKSSSGKSSSGSAGKKSKSRHIPDFWNDS